MKYSIVIATYNHCDDLLKPCVESILKFTDIDSIELIIVANGCTDETSLYLNYLSNYFKNKGKEQNFKFLFFEKALGYAKSANEGIKLATCNKIILLNNDAVLLEQEKNMWVNLLESPFLTNPKCGISCVVKCLEEIIQKEYAIFFCVMIDKKVFDTIGLLNVEYEVGGCEDVEFSIEAEKAGFEIVECTKKFTIREQLWGGMFPIYHNGHGTINDPVLVPMWDEVFSKNKNKLHQKYGPTAKTTAIE